MKTFRFLIFFSLTISSIFIGLYLLKYSSFKRDFSDRNDITCYSFLDEQSLEIDEKIKSFSTSDVLTEFVVLDVEETVYILKNSVGEDENMEIEDLCVYPQKGAWQIYLKYENIPWLSFYLIKDDRETAELYVRDFNVGDSIEIPFFGKRITEEINLGISDGILLANENEFLGREIRNIELFEDKVVVKGSLY